MERQIAWIGSSNDLLGRCKFQPQGLGQDKEDGFGGWQGANGLSELHIRNMFATWVDYMSSDD